MFPIRLEGFILGTINHLQSEFVLKIRGFAYFVVNLDKMIIENNNTNFILLTFSILLYT